VQLSSTITIAITVTTNQHPSSIIHQPFIIG
jgi:hypothetical protein